MRGENSGAGHGEQCHGFGKAVDGVAPRLAQQEEDGGDECAGVADTDPPDEVDDGEAPADGDGHAPDADALQEEIADGIEHHHREHEADAEADEPAVRSGTGQHDRADFFRDRAEGVSGLDDRSSIADGRPICLGSVHFGSSASLARLALSFPSSGFGFRIFCQVRGSGRVFSSPSRL